VIVIADSSPVIVLVNIGHINLLPFLFKAVVIPSQVAAELRQANRPAAVKDFVGRPPPWLSIRTPLSSDAIEGLDAGETAAIQLAGEIKADLLLMDELRGRKVAAERNIAITGTIGVLELAATRKLLDLKEAFEQVKQTDFWISPALLDARLKLFLKTDLGKR
jgi:predicted nucleic acid-binding protein